jgi:hypothetical protein
MSLQVISASFVLASGEILSKNIIIQAPLANPEKPGGREKSGFLELPRIEVSA